MADPTASALYDYEEFRVCVFRTIKNFMNVYLVRKFQRLKPSLNLSRRGSVVIVLCGCAVAS